MDLSAQPGAMVDRLRSSQFGEMGGGGLIGLTTEVGEGDAGASAGLFALRGGYLRENIGHLGQVGTGEGAASYAVRLAGRGYGRQAGHVLGLQGRQRGRIEIKKGTFDHAF